MDGRMVSLKLNNSRLQTRKRNVMDGRMVSLKLNNSRLQTRKRNVMDVAEFQNPNTDVSSLS
jgi:N-acetylmuramic acid 6-phosphate (MurNAc-6-P) etherase